MNKISLNQKLLFLAPLTNLIFENKILLRGYRPGLALVIFRKLSSNVPEVEWNLESTFPIKAKSIAKIKDRKIRKACYQSFANYKKSFRPFPKPKLKIIKDEWKTDDMADAMLYALFQWKEMTRQNFEKQYMCTWDLASDHTEDKSIFMDI